MYFVTFMPVSDMIHMSSVPPMFGEESYTINEKMKIFKMNAMGVATAPTKAKQIYLEHPPYLFYGLYHTGFL